MRLRSILLIVCLLVVGCTPGKPPSTQGPSSSASSSASGSAVPPSPSTTPIAADPGGLALQLATVTTQLRSSIEEWRAGGGTASWPPPEDLVLLALAQQRIYGTLSLHPRLLRRVLPRLPEDLRSEALDDAAAGAQLISLVTPSRRAVTFRTRAPLPADALLGYYREAEQRFGVRWEVLAAVNFIESRFGRVISNSSAGAQGPMQFIPSTWAYYGLGGNVHVPRDAILGAANYLHASGSPRDDAVALHSYNPSRAYVRAVTLYARQMMRDPRTFYAYYNWQVFVLTPTGLKQLTGPGGSGG